MSSYVKASADVQWFDGASYAYQVGPNSSLAPVRFGGLNAAKQASALSNIRGIQRLFMGCGKIATMKPYAALALALLATAAGPQAQPPESVDVEHSKMTVYVYKQGLFSFLADNHTIEAPIARGSYDAERGTVEIIVDASKMRVLDPSLAADKRATVQSNMLGPQVLDVAKYPTISFQSTSMKADHNGTSTVTGNLNLHGQARSITVRVRNDGLGHFTGSATVPQTAFGITPIKVAGGAVTVKDDVRVDFDIAVKSP
jgi:polyisoprenoid-binding protein YceI